MEKATSLNGNGNNDGYGDDRFIHKAFTLIMEM